MGGGEGRSEDIIIGTATAAVLYKRSTMVPYPPVMLFAPHIFGRENISVLPGLIYVLSKT